LAVEVLRTSGELQFMARGASMVPAIFPGDLLLVRRQPIAAARCGEVALWSRNARLCAHRVLHCVDTEEETAIVTRGDALRDPDPPVTTDEFLGCVYAVVRRGKQIDLTARRNALSCAIAYLARQSDLVSAFLIRWNSFLCILAARQNPFLANENADLLESQ